MNFVRAQTAYKRMLLNLDNILFVEETSDVSTQRIIVHYGSVSVHLLMSIEDFERNVEAYRKEQKNA